MNEFSTFDVASGCVVLATPLILVLLLRPWLLRVIDDEPTLDQVNKLTAAVGSMTLLLLAGYIGIHMFSTPDGHYTKSQPWLMWLLCFLPFLLFTMPSVLVARKYATRNSRNADEPNAKNASTRSASLRPREFDSPISRSAWILIWSVWLVGMAALVWLLAYPRGDADFISTAFQVMMPIFCAGVLLVGPRSLRILAHEAEPLDAVKSPELSKGYRALRDFRARARFYLIPVGLTFTTTALMCGLAWGVQATTVLGACMVVLFILGIASAVCAVIANVRRAQLTEVLDRLSTGSTELTS